MKFTDLFVKRPVRVSPAAILIAGLRAIRSASQYLRTSTRRSHRDDGLCQPTPISSAAASHTARVIASADGIDYMESSSARG
jgi:hypothetical protein